MHFFAIYLWACLAWPWVHSFRGMPIFGRGSPAGSANAIIQLAIFVQNFFDAVYPVMVMISVEVGPPKRGYRALIIFRDEIS